MTYANQIETLCGGAENIEAIVVGLFPGTWGNEDESTAYAWGRNPRTPIPPDLRNKPQTWDTMRSYLDYNYDQGFGTEECHPVLVYTKDDRVIVSGCYDGSTWLEAIPTKPIETAPEFIGGG